MTRMSNALENRLFGLPVEQEPHRRLDATRGLRAEPRPAPGFVGLHRDPMPAFAARVAHDDVERERVDKIGSDGYLESAHRTNIEFSRRPQRARAASNEGEKQAPAARVSRFQLRRRLGPAASKVLRARPSMRPVGTNVGIRGFVVASARRPAQRMTMAHDMTDLHVLGGGVGASLRFAGRMGRGRPRPGIWRRDPRRKEMGKSTVPAPFRTGPRRFFETPCFTGGSRLRSRLALLVQRNRGETGGRRPLRNTLSPKKLLSSGKGR